MASSSKPSRSSVLAARGKPEEALAAYERALAIHGAAVGTKSALYAGTATSIANTLLALKRLPEARSRIETALAIYAAHPDDRDVIGTLMVAAQIDAASGDRAAALVHANRAVEIADGDPATPAGSIHPLLVRAELLRDAGRRDDARRDVARAKAILDAHPQSPALRDEVAKLVAELSR